MDREAKSPSIVSIKSCNCSCGCNFHAGAAAASSSSSPPTSPWPRCTKRKLEQIFNEYQNKPADTPNAPFLSIARVEIENECAALREALRNQHQTIQELYTELEEERNAAASAANEAMSMILRLQREKAEAQLESRQYKRYAEEKIAHDQLELQELEELLYRREQLIHALNSEVSMYKHRLLGGESGEQIEAVDGMVSSRNSDVEKNIEFGDECSLLEYPPLKCDLNQVHDSSNAIENQVDLEKYALGDIPLDQEHLQNLEFRIGQLEKSPEGCFMDGEFATTRSFLDKAILNEPAMKSKHYRGTSQDSNGSSMAVIKEVNVGKEFESEAASPVIKVNDWARTGKNSFPREVGLDFGDDGDDRVYTVDSVHEIACNGNGQHELESWNKNNGAHPTSSIEISARAEAGEIDIKKLYMRLQALEADRESMRQEIISMSTDKAQLVLLKEVAQQLCVKKTMPITKPSVAPSFSLLSFLKWVVSFLFWKKKGRRSKFMYDLSNKNLGLLLLLEKSPPKQWRCLSRLPRR